jgi:hypothetical protein
MCRCQRRDVDFQYARRQELQGGRQWSGILHVAGTPPRAKPVGAAANPSPAGFPRVQEDTQKARDTDRRHILEQELAGEQRNLEQARKELAEQEALRGSRERDGALSRSRRAARAQHSGDPERTGNLR